MRKAILVLTLLAVVITSFSVVNAVTIRGRVDYDGTWPADSVIYVLAIPDSFSIADPMAFLGRIGMVAIAAPDTYTIVNDSISGTWWYVMATSGSASMPDIASMARCGASPANPFQLVDGSAEGVNITVAAIGAAAGVIRNAPGDAANMAIKIHDVYSEVPVFPGIGSTDHQYTPRGVPTTWSISDIHSGPKRFIAFIDANLNDTLDAGEDSAMALNGFGNVFIIGGGPTLEGIVIDFNNTGVASEPRVVTAGLRVSPNPARDRVDIPFNLYRANSASATVRVLDLSGRCIARTEVAARYGRNHWTWDATSAPAGVYTAEITSGSSVAQLRIVLTK